MDHRAADNHERRSQFVRQLILDSGESGSSSEPTLPPRCLVQFWDDLTTVPADVQRCLDSWIPLLEAGFERLLFDDVSAARYIALHFTARYQDAFTRCIHPAMRADYFRLCFMVEHGGFYADADDELQGPDIDGPLQDGALKLQPLCYDIATDSMVDPWQAARAGVSRDKDLLCQQIHS